jgi:putative transposase
MFPGKPENRLTFSLLSRYLIHRFQPFIPCRGHGLDMKEKDKRPNQRSIRLPGYDYSRTGAYFVTICTKDRKCLFGDIVNREMVLNDPGQMVKKWHGELENKFPDIKCNKHIIMPNHFHAIIQNAGADPVYPVGADLRVCPGTGAKQKSGEHKNTGEHKKPGEHIGSPLPQVVQWFKTMTTNEYIRGVKQHGWPPFPGKLWQRNYYEHIIRNENDMAHIREYITNNPARWHTDRQNPMAKTTTSPDGPWRNQ